MSFCEKILGKVGKTIDKGVEAGQKAKIIQKSRVCVAKVLNSISKVVKPNDESPKEKKE